MTEQKIPARWSIIAGIIILVSLSRLIPYLFQVEDSFNFTPLAAVALFGGAYFIKRTSAVLIPLLALWASNLLIDNIYLSAYYPGVAIFENWEVYLAILAIVLLSFIILKKVTAGRVIIASLAASVSFFVISNLMVWLEGTLYPMTWEGLMTCYEMAIPFFRNTLTSDILFSTMLFGIFELVKAKYPDLVLERA